MERRREQLVSSGEKLLIGSSLFSYSSRCLWRRLSFTEYSRKQISFDLNDSTFSAVNSSSSSRYRAVPFLLSSSSLQQENSIDY